MSGVVASGDVGSVGSGFSQTLSGVVASGSVGTAGIIRERDISGVGSSGAVQPFPNVIPFSGVAARGNVGSIGVLYWGLINNYQDAQWELVETE